MDDFKGPDIRILLITPLRYNQLANGLALSEDGKTVVYTLDTQTWLDVTATVTIGFGITENLSFQNLNLRKSSKDLCTTKFSINNLNWRIEIVRKRGDESTTFAFALRSFVYTTDFAADSHVAAGKIDAAKGDIFSVVLLLDEPQECNKELIVLSDLIFTGGLYHPEQCK